MRIVWTRGAIRDLVSIRRYIELHNPHAASSVAERIVDAAESLAQFSNRGRPGRIPGTREFVIPGSPFIIPYQVTGEDVRILRLLHGARREGRQ